MKAGFNATPVKGGGVERNFWIITRKRLFVAYIH